MMQKGPLSPYRRRENFRRIASSPSCTSRRQGACRIPPNLGSSEQYVPGTIWLFVANAIPRTAVYGTQFDDRQHCLVESPSLTIPAVNSDRLRNPCERSGRLSSGGLPMVAFDAPCGSGRNFLLFGPSGCAAVYSAKLSRSLDCAGRASTSNVRRLFICHHDLTRTPG